MINYSICKKSIDIKEIIELLFQYDSYFIPKISDRINLKEYGKKLFSNATFVLAKNKNTIVGFAAFYFNFSPQATYLPLMAVNKNFQGSRIGNTMIKKIVNYCHTKNSSGILLEMRADNSKLFKFYSDLGFKIKDKFESPLNGEIKYHMYLTIKNIDKR